MKRTVCPLALLGAAVLFLAQSCMAQQSTHSSASADGAKIFASNCSMCHGDDGRGSAVGKSLHIPDLHSGAVQAKSDAALEHFISEGSGAMPAFKDSLDHQQIVDVAHYVRSFGKRE